MIFVDTLKWDLNTETITKKGHQPLHLLQKLRSFNVDPTLKLFYISFIDSVLIFSFICWFYNLNTKQTNSLQRIVNFSSKINLCLVIKLQLYPCYVTKIFYQKWNLFQRTPTEHALYRKFEHLPHELRCMMFRSLAHNINCSLTPQQGMIRD